MGTTVIGRPGILALVRVACAAAVLMGSAAAQARFDAIKTKLDHARTLNDHTGTALIVTAIGLILSAGLLYRSNSKPADQ